MIIFANRNNIPEMKIGQIGINLLPNYQQINS